MQTLNYYQHIALIILHMQSKKKKDFMIPAAGDVGQPVNAYFMKYNA